MTAQQERSSNRLAVRRLAYGLGAEVLGIDLRQPLDDDTVQEIRAAWLEHSVLVFPEQDITPDQHVAFTRRFGTPIIHPIDFYNHPDRPEIFLVASHGRDGKPSPTRDVARQYHSDMAYTTRPALGSMLHCQEKPAVGGDTCFTSMYLAYERLSDTMKKVIEPLWALRDITNTKGFKNRTPEQAAQLRRDFPVVAQPLVKVHSETGRKALYIQENSPGIVGMTEEESRPLIDFLTRHATQPAFSYRHRWKLHDLVWWDNRCTMHLAVKDFDEGERRIMYRTTLDGEPSGHVYTPGAG